MVVERNGLGGTESGSIDVRNLGEQTMVILRSGAAQKTARRTADVRLAFQISVGLTVEKRRKKKTPVITTLRKSTKNHQYCSTC
jgi:hypothetical protein